MNCTHCSSDQYSINVTCANCGIIYKALPHWVDLTDDEMLMIYGQNHEGKKYNLGRMVQQALKEKNS